MSRRVAIARLVTFMVFVVAALLAVALSGSLSVGRVRPRAGGSGPPRTFAYTALGGQLGSFGSWQFLLALAVLALMAAFGIWLAAQDPELRAAVGRLASRARLR